MTDGPTRTADPAADSVTDLAPGYARRAENLHRRGESATALRILTAGAARYPGDLTARLVLARVCRESGREAEARDWLEAALRADPECPAARRLLAELDAGNPPVPEARTPEPAPRTETAVLRKDPAPTFTFPVREEEEEPEIEENSAPHVATVTLAEIYLQQGLKEQAAQIYRQLLERQPGDDSVRRRLQEIEGI